MFKRVTALLPMRHDSKRVIGKNYRPIGGKLLYQHILDTLLRIPEITQVVVDTDSPILKESLREHYPQVAVIDRPSDLCADTIPMNTILLYDTAQCEADLFLQTHSTNPLLSADTISRALKAFKEAWPRYDSLMGVNRYQSRFWTADGKPINHDPAIMLRSQDLKPVYEDNSCIYLFTRENLVKYSSRVGQTPLLFEVPKLESQDIDEEDDFTLAEMLIAARDRTKEKDN